MKPGKGGFHDEGFHDELPSLFPRFCLHDSASGAGRGWPLSGPLAKDPASSGIPTVSRWRTVLRQVVGPRFAQISFPAGFVPYRITDSRAVGVVTDGFSLQRLATVDIFAAVTAVAALTGPTDKEFPGQ